MFLTLLLVIVALIKQDEQKQVREERADFSLHPGDGLHHGSEGKAAGS